MQKEDFMHPPSNYLRPVRNSGQVYPRDADPQGTATAAPLAVVVAFAQLGDMNMASGKERFTGCECVSGGGAG